NARQLRRTTAAISARSIIGFASSRTRSVLRSGTPPWAATPAGAPAASHPQHASAAARRPARGSRPRAARLLKATLDGIDLGVQGPVAGIARRVEHGRVPPRTVVHKPALLHRRQP